MGCRWNFYEYLAFIKTVASDQWPGWVHPNESKNTWQLEKDALAGRYANAATQRKSACTDLVCIAPDF